MSGIRIGFSASGAFDSVEDALDAVDAFSGRTRDAKEKKRGLSPVASAEHEDLTAALDALRHCRNRISSDPTFGACPLGLDELIALLEQKWRMK